VSFSFDPGLSAEENLARFRQHLEKSEPEMAKILYAHIDAMLPLPGTGPAKQKARKSFNQAVLKALPSSAEEK